jgi:membrane protein
MFGLVRRTVSRVRWLLRRAPVYFRSHIWQTQGQPRNRLRRVVHAFSRLLYLSVHGFFDKNLSQRASALTYMSLLALVPVLALAFSLSKGFGLQNAVRAAILDRLAVGQQEVVEKLLAYVDRTDVKALGSIGVLFIIYTAVSVLGRIEKNFNEIWGVTRGRSWSRKFADYLSVLLIAPVLVITATGFNATLTSNRLVGRLMELPFFSGALKTLLGFTPLFAIWVAFTFVYMFVPNTRVRFTAALSAGLFAGTLWHFTQWAFIHFQVGVSRYNAIYGTFASLPVFMVWLQISWIIVLLGCDVAYAVQHLKTYHPPLPEGFLSIAQREQTALLVLLEVVRRFRLGEPPPEEGDVAALAGIPSKLVARIVDQLVDCGLLAKVEAPEEGLLPARDLLEMRVSELLNRFRHQGVSRPAENGEELTRLVREIHGLLEQGWLAGLDARVRDLALDARLDCGGARVSPAAEGV